MDILVNPLPNRFLAPIRHTKEAEENKKSRILRFVWEGWFFIPTIRIKV